MWKNIESEFLSSYCFEHSTSRFSKPYRIIYCTCCHTWQIIRIFLFQIENWAHFRGDLRPVRAQRNRFRQNRKNTEKSHDEWLVDIYSYWLKVAVDQKTIEVGTKPRTFLLKGTIVKNLKWAWDNNPEICSKKIIFLFGCSFEIDHNLTQKAAFLINLVFKSRFSSLISITYSTQKYRFLPSTVWLEKKLRTNISKFFCECLKSVTF